MVNDDLLFNIGLFGLILLLLLGTHHWSRSGAGRGGMRPA
jgi:hypothetical protein